RPRRLSLLALALVGALLVPERAAFAQSGARISEVFFACASGDTATQYIELENTGPDTVLTSTLRVQYSLDEATGLFLLSPTTSAAGLPWPHGGHFLIANPNLLSRLQFQPDFSSASVRLSRRQGILRLYSLAGGVPTDLAEIRYGTQGPQPAPPDGWS